MYLNRASANHAQPDRRLERLQSAMPLYVPREIKNPRDSLLRQLFVCLLFIPACMKLSLLDGISQTIARSLPFRSAARARAQAQNKHFFAQNYETVALWPIY